MPAGVVEALQLEEKLLAQGLHSAPLPEPELLVLAPGKRRRKSRAKVRAPGVQSTVQSEPPPPLETAPPVVPEPDVPVTEAAPVPSGYDQPNPPLPEVPNWTAAKADPGIRTADIISFPRAALPASRRAAAIQLLPDATGEEKAKLRITLAAIRAMMSLEQVQQLEYHETLLRR
jgi:hypothetical protein